MNLREKILTQSEKNFDNAKKFFEYLMGGATTANPVHTEFFIGSYRMFVETHALAKHYNETHPGDDKIVNVEVYHKEYIKNTELSVKLLINTMLR